MKSKAQLVEERKKFPDRFSGIRVISHKQSWGKIHNLEEVEVFATKGNRVRSKVMSVTEWRELKKSKSWNYRAYQLRFSTMTATEKWK